MTYTVHDVGAFYAAVVTRLTAQTGKNIGRGEAPSDKTTPYAVVYGLDDSSAGTSLGDPEETTVNMFQVTSVGKTAEQAEWMAVKARTALLGWEPSVSGRVFGRVAKVGGRPAARDDSTQPPLFYAIDDYDVFTS